MDLIESPLFTPPIILLQTVMEEVRHRSLPLYNRLKALTKMDDKKMWIFYNEYRSYVFDSLHSERSLTGVERLQLFGRRARRRMTEMIEVSSLYIHMNINESSAGIRKAAAWYTSHISTNRPPVRGQPPPKLPTVVLMTEDAANSQKAQKSGIVSTSGQLSNITRCLQTH
jgi:exosome complex exonuclease DIS3/RRP44